MSATTPTKSTKSSDKKAKKLVMKPAAKPATEEPLNVEEPRVDTRVDTPKQVKKSKKTEETLKKEEVKEEALPKKSSKKSTKKTEETLKKEEVKEALPKKSSKKAAKKTEEAPVKKEEEEKKKAKKININPTISDAQGLNISVAKVKNIINLCINHHPYYALKNMKDARVFLDHADPEDEEKGARKRFTFSLDLLTEETRTYLDKCYLTLLESNRVTHCKEYIKKLSAEKKKEYTAAKKQAVSEHQAVQKTAHLFQLHEFDLTSFNLKWDPNFYKNMETGSWKSLKNMELYSYCTNLVNKVKVRFNAESKIFITAFIECILRQLVTNGTLNCIKDGNKIIQIRHALDSSSKDFQERFPLSPLISNLETYRKHLASTEEPTEEPAAEDHSTEEHDEDQTPEGDTGRKFQFKHYVTELCRSVRIELAKKDSSVEDMIKSPYIEACVSKPFKQFCSNIIVDLIRVFGNILKTEVSTRSVKTVNYTIVKTLLQVSHIICGLDAELDNTVSFIQDKYCLYNEYLKTRSSKRSSNNDEDSDEE
jgi:hypothetical protein